MKLNLVKQLSEKQLLLVTAESCTGGLVAKQVTDLPGSSSIFDCGFVTYSNSSKQNLLAVKNETLDNYGAVSEQTAKQMAEGALKNSQANLALSITGIAGPDGGTKEKPVGTVCFGWAKTGEKTITETRYFTGDRNSIRIQASNHALQTITEIINP